MENLIEKLIENEITTEEILAEIDKMDCLFSGEIQVG
jgi:hypothetical protein